MAGDLCSRQLVAVLIHLNMTARVAEDARVLAVVGPRGMQRAPITMDEHPPNFDRHADRHTPTGGRLDRKHGQISPWPMVSEVTPRFSRVGVLGTSSVQLARLGAYSKSTHGRGATSLLALAAAVGLGQPANAVVASPHVSIPARRAYMQHGRASWLAPGWQPCW